MACLDLNFQICGSHSKYVNARPNESAQPYMLRQLNTWFKRKPPQTTDPQDPINDDALPPIEKLLADIEMLSATDPEAVELAVLYDKLGRAYIQQADRYEVYYSAVAKPVVEAFQQAAAGYKRQGNINAEAAALNRLASSYNADSKFTEGLQAGKDALTTAKVAASPWQKMTAFAEMGNAELYQGKAHKALRYYKKSLRIAKSIHDPRSAAIALSNIGICWFHQEIYSWSIRSTNSALKIYRRIGDHSDETRCLTSIADVYAKIKRRKRALKYLQQALAIQHEAEDQHGEAAALIRLGDFYLSSKQLEKALDFYQHSYELAKKIGDRRGEAYASSSIGNAYALMNQLQLAITYLQRSLKIFEEIGERYDQAATVEHLGRVYYHLDPQNPQAINCLQQSIVVRREIGDYHGEAIALWYLAGVYVGQGDDLSAKQALEQAKAIGLEINDADIINQCRGAAERQDRKLKVQARQSPLFEHKSSQRPFKETEAFDPDRVAVYKSLPIWVWFLFVGGGLFMLLIWVFD